MGIATSNESEVAIITAKSEVDVRSCLQQVRGGHRRLQQSKIEVAVITAIKQGRVYVPPASKNWT